MPNNEDFQASLPRSEKTMDGSNFSIVEIGPVGEAVIFDAERTAAYVPLEGPPLTGPNIRIRPKYIEAGAFCEANCVTLTDGSRTAIYVPREKFCGLG